MTDITQEGRTGGDAMTELTDEAVKALAHRYRFAADDHEQTIAKTAEALLDARADAQAAVAVALEDAAQKCEFRDHSEGEEETEFDLGYDQACDECAVIVRAFVPADGLAAVEALRKEIEALQTDLTSYMDAANEYMRGEEAARAELAAAKQREARRTFPILKGDGAKIDYQLVADHSEQARRNHYQSVDQLASRGGLSWGELYAVLHNRECEKVDTNEAIIACRSLEARYLAALADTDGLAAVEALRKERERLAAEAATIRQGDTP